MTRVVAFLRMFLLLIVLIGTVGHVYAIEKTLLLHMTSDRKWELARALVRASWSGDVKRVKSLIAQKADVNDAVDLDGNSPLHIAVQRGDGTMAELLIVEGAKPFEYPNNEGKAPYDVASHEMIRRMAEAVKKRDAERRETYKVAIGIRSAL